MPQAFIKKLLLLFPPYAQADITKILILVR